MIITCNNCNKKFDIDSTLIPDKGRLLQCASCDHKWFFKKEVFEKVGYFDEELVRNQDDEFNFRVIKGGFKIYLTQKIRSKYYVRGSFNKLYRQYYQYGYWKVFVNQKHGEVTSIRQLIPPAFVAFLLF